VEKDSGYDDPFAYHVAATSEILWIGALGRLGPASSLELTWTRNLLNAVQLGDGVKNIDDLFRDSDSFLV
jgi:hypothetical protein